MPTYEYECDRCGHRFERFQKISDTPLQRCPVCRGKIRRMFGPGAGILFKGSGFYATDYRSGSYKEAQKKEKGESVSAGKSAAPADSKKPAKAGGNPGRTE
ncbi:MAG: zinc ribbon domain-containing protein [Lentisphaerae bacterium]|nr:zinc ribbon domain-containing protein [Lentisphaerota bacterium]